jgi:hypothetical protein
MKTITAALLIFGSSVLSQANDQRYFYKQTGNGYTKGDAVASALLKLPFGAKIEKVNINGHAIHQHVKGIGYIQTYGSHKATVHYSN